MALDTALRADAAQAGHAPALLTHVADRRVGDTVIPVRDDARVLHRDAIFRRSLAIADLLALGLTGVVVLGVAQLRPGALVLGALVLIAAKTMSLYDRDQVVIAKRSLDDAPGMFQLATLVSLVFWLGGTFFTDQRPSPHEVLTVWIVLFGALLTLRAIARCVAKEVAPIERCLVIAEADDHRRVDAKLALDTRLKARVVAHLPMVERRSGSFEPPHTALERCVRDMDIHRVVLAPDGVDAGVVLDIVNRAKSLGVNVSVLPRICEVVGSSVRFDDLGGMTLLGVRAFRLSRSTQILKRSVDLVVSTLALVVAAPLLAAIVVAIRLDSRGPILFRQTRVGKDGRHFEMLKFRSMVDGAHAGRDELSQHSHGNGLFKVADDPRVTRVGRLLRRSSLDEMPQLLNVLRGQMSLVGPRPLIIEEDALVVGHHRRRLHLKPGLTGPWQVLGSADVRVGLEDMATIDYLYTVNWSLWADVQVILRTVLYVLGGRGL